MRDELLKIIEKTTLNNADEIRNIFESNKSKLTRTTSFIDVYKADNNIELLFDYNDDALYIKIFLKTHNDIDILYLLKVEYKIDIIIDILLSIQNKNIDIDII